MKMREISVRYGLVYVIFSMSFLGCEKNQKTDFQSANKKVNEGHVQSCTAEELDALRTDREARDKTYKALCDKKLEEKLTKFSKEEVEAYWSIRRAMDAYAETHDDFPIEKQEELFAEFAVKLGKTVNDLQANYLKIDAETILTTSELNEINTLLKNGSN